MKKQIDADKILSHIQYTKHWLDKADEDYKNKRFGNGAMNVGLARADLTAAWELALHLKTQIFHTMPKKARGLANWKSASAVGLLASGFLMAFMINQFATNALVSQNGQAVQSHAIVITEQPSKAAQPARQTAPVEINTTVIEPDVIVEDAAAALETNKAEAEQPRRKTPARYYERQSTSRYESQPVESIAVPQPEPAALQPVIPAPDARETVRIITVAPKKSKLDQIDLYTTANDSIMNSN